MIYVKMPTGHKDPTLNEYDDTEYVVSMPSGPGHLVFTPKNLHRTLTRFLFYNARRP